MTPELKEAYKKVVRYEVQMENEYKELNLTNEQIDKLAEEIHDSEDFIQHLGICIENAVDFWMEELGMEEA
jgi:hypothetical protein